MLFIAILLIVIFIIGTIVYCSQPSEEPYLDDSSPVEHIYADDSDSDGKSAATDAIDLIAALKNSLSKNPLLPKYKDLFNQYNTQFTGAYEQYFVDGNVPKIRKISLFGIAMISKYVETNRSAYLSIAEDLIENTIEKLNKTKITDKEIPWGINWYDISVLLTRMLVTYQLTDGNKELKQKSHDTIIKIIPKINESLGRNPYGLDVASILITRLITNSINKREEFIHDTESELFETLVDEICTLALTVDTTSDGFFLDYSSVENKVATFENLSKFSEFYAVAFRSLNYRMDVDAYIASIFHKIFHPSMDFIPYGLFGVEPKITCTEFLSHNWPNYERKSTLGVKIFPRVGLGIFKSSKFVFSLRVQLPGIAAYESDPENFEFPAGWIQMRKLYLKDVDYTKYDNEIKWPELKLQPGVIYFADDNPNDFDKLKSVSGRKQFVVKNVKSLIGHLQHRGESVMYWKNEYNFEIYQNVDIIEFGICTENGLVMRHDVTNKSNRVLKMKLTDDDIAGYLMHFDGQFSGLNYSEGVVTIGANARQVIKWRQVFNPKGEPTEVDLDTTRLNISFSIDTDVYVIEPYDDYHVVRCNGDLTLAGSVKTFSQNTIDHMSICKFELNATTLMYQRSR